MEIVWKVLEKLLESVWKVLEIFLEGSWKVPNRCVVVCTHWCSPGVPDTWNEILSAKIRLKEAEGVGKVEAKKITDHTH